MPASIVAGQVASGGVSSTSVNVTLPAGTTAGNTVLVVFGTYQRTMATTAGFVIDSPASVANARVQVFRRSNVPAAETSWTFTTAVANAESWVAFEVEGMDDASPLDVVVSAVSALSSGTAITSNTTPQSTAYDAFALAAWVGTITGTTPGSLSGITSGFTEIAQVGAAGAANSAVLSVASLPAQALSTFTSTATHSATLTATVPGAGVALVYAAAGSKRAADVVAACGFEFGTAAGLATAGVAGALIFDVVNGSPAVVATAPRTGSYCLELSAAAAAENVNWSSNTLGSSGAYGVLRLGVYFPGSLPASDVMLFALAGAVGLNTGAFFWYRSASQKVGAFLEQSSPALLGTEQVALTTVQADTWYTFDVRWDASTSTSVLDWQLDGADQPQATLSGTAGLAVAAVTLGWVAASTATVRFDDVVYSKTRGHYPLGDMRVYPLKVDPAGTVTVSGTTGNFGVMTTNGTIAAWNATNALAAVDDIPPTIGASADGVVAVAAHATDYVEFPMETYAAAANGAAIRAVRAYFALWAASATAATIRLSAYDGTTTYSLLAETDPNADNSTTTPVWVAKMVRTSASVRPDWTQAKLDALVLRMGSNDATPDIGVHAVLCELVVRVGDARSVIGDAGSPVTTAEVDPDSGAVLAATLDATGLPLGGTLRWSDSGGAGSQVVAAGGSYTKTFPAAVDVSEVTLVQVDPDPDPDQPG